MLISSAAIPTQLTDPQRLYREGECQTAPDTQGFYERIRAWSGQRGVMFGPDKRKAIGHLKQQAVDIGKRPVERGNEFGNLAADNLERRHVDVCRLIDQPFGKLAVDPAADPLPRLLLFSQ